MAGMPTGDAVILNLSQALADRNPMGPSAPAAPESRFRLGQRPALDGLRAIAVLAVMLFHLNPALLPGGYLGVDIFFVLSGFLITSLLLEEWQTTGRINVVRFYWRRVTRLMPALTLMVGCCWCYAALYLPRNIQENVKDSGILVLAFQTDWWFAHNMGFLSFFAHTWSLAVEAKFYIVWPLVLTGLLTARVRPRWLVAALVTGILSCAAYRWSLLPAAGSKAFPWLYPHLQLRADAFLTGALVAALAAFNMLPQSARFRTLLQGFAQGAAAILFILLYDGPGYQTQMYPMFHGLFTVVAAGVGVILVALLQGPGPVATAVMESSFLTWIGKLSYGLYLWHFPVLMLFLPSASLSLPGPLIWKTQALLTLTIAAASFYAVERPLFRWRRTAAPQPLSIAETEVVRQAA